LGSALANKEKLRDGERDGDRDKLGNDAGKETEVARESVIFSFHQYFRPSKVSPIALDLETGTNSRMAENGSKMTETTETRPERRGSRPKFDGNWTKIGGLRPTNEIADGGERIDHIDEGERERVI
jgi:hypothetical protein